MLFLTPNQECQSSEGIADTSSQELRDCVGESFNCLLAIADDNYNNKDYSKYFVFRINIKS